MVLPIINANETSPCIALFPAGGEVETRDSLVVFPIFSPRCAGSSDSPEAPALAPKLRLHCAVSHACSTALGVTACCPCLCLCHSSSIRAVLPLLPNTKPRLCPGACSRAPAASFVCGVWGGDASGQHVFVRGGALRAVL